MHRSVERQQKWVDARAATSCTAIKSAKHSLALHTVYIDARMSTLPSSMRSDPLQAPSLLNPSIPKRTPEPSAISGDSVRSAARWSVIRARRAQGTVNTARFASWRVRNPIFGANRSTETWRKRCRAALRGSCPPRNQRVGWSVGVEPLANHIKRMICAFLLSQPGTRCTSSSQSIGSDCDNCDLEFLPCSCSERKSLSSSCCLASHPRRDPKSGASGETN